MTFDEWWDTTKATATPETFAGWEQSCRQAWNAGFTAALADRERAIAEAVAGERENIRARLLLMDDGANRRHNYYAHAAWVIFGEGDSARSGAKG